MSTAEVVPGRACGDCRVCCITPTIDDLEIQKKSNTQCRHCTSGGTNGCAIYADRPGPCRAFYCAWRRSASFPEDWRPDLTGVFGTLDPATIDGKQVIALTVTLLRDEMIIIRHYPFVDFIRTNMLSDLPIYLALPGPPGHRPLRALLNGPAMREAARHSAEQVCGLLHRAVETIKAHPPLPYTLQHAGNNTGDTANDSRHAQN